MLLKRGREGETGGGGEEGGGGREGGERVLKRLFRSWRRQGAKGGGKEKILAHSSSGVIICTFVLVKQVN
jgi:hypothetical protein